MMKGQKGITLVALIITIIVMLILVGVSISVALNGGLFDKATKASDETRKSQITEAIALAKSDIVSNYYDPTTTEGKDVLDAEAVATAINVYLTDSGITLTEDDVEVSTTTTGTVYTISAPEATGLTLDKGNTITCNFWKSE